MIDSSKEYWDASGGPEKARPAWKDPLLYISVLFNIAVHYLWFFSTSILTFGDTLYSFPNQLKQITSFQVWSPLYMGGIEIMPSAYPCYYLSGLLARIGFSSPVIQRVIFLWPLVIVGSIGSYLLIKKISGNSLGGLVGSIVFNFNTFFIVSTSNHVPIAAAIAWFPLAFYLFIRLSEKPSLGRALASVVPLFIISFLEFRVFYICCFILLLFYVFSLRSGRQKRGILTYSLLFFLPLALAVMLNGYWLFPYYVKGLKGGLQGVTIGRAIFTGGTRGTNLLQNSLALFDQTWSGGQLQPFSVHTIPFYWFLLPLLAFSVFFFDKLRKKTYILFFALVALIGIFLSKFYFSPFPGAYEWLYQHFPGFNAFREPSKFTFLIFSSYAVLIGCLFAYLRKRLWGKAWKNLIFLILLILVLAPFIFNTTLISNGSLGTLFVSRSLPKDYQVLEDFTVSQSDFFRTLWVPSFSRWSYFDNEHPLVSCVGAIGDDWKELQDPDRLDVLKPENIVNILQRPFSEELLKSASIKYVVVPPQPVNEGYDFLADYGGDRQYFIDRLNELGYLERIDIGTEELAVFEVRDYNTPAYASDAICRLESQGDIGSQYLLGKSIWGADLPFTLADGASPSIRTNEMEIRDLLPAGNESAGVSAGNMILKLPAATAGEGSTIYADQGRGELHCLFKGRTVVIRRTKCVLISNNGMPVYGFKDSGDTLRAIQVNPADDVWVEADGTWFRLEQGKDVSLGEISRVSSLRLHTVDRQNLIPNGSFEEGLWGSEVVDCSAFDDNRIIGMELNREEATDGNYSLELDATRHVAGTYTIFPVPENVECSFAFDYQSPNSREAGYHLEFDDPAKTVISERLPISGNAWHHFRSSVTVPTGATKATLYVYSFDTDGNTDMITRYDNFELRVNSTISEVNISKAYDRFTKLEIQPGTTEAQFALNPAQTNGENLISNGSFEQGLWGNAPIDCDAWDDNPVLGMELNDTEATDGTYSLQLEAARHVAGTSTIIPIKGNREYSLRFDYESPNAKKATYSLLFNDKDSTTVSNDIPISDTGWHQYQTNLIAPLGATAATLFVYASQSDGKTRIINRYDDFEFWRTQPGAGIFYSVKIPEKQRGQGSALEFSDSQATEKTVKLDSASSPFVLILGQKYDPGWKLTVKEESGDGPDSSRTVSLEQIMIDEDNHLKIDGSYNGWYIDPSRLTNNDGTQQGTLEATNLEITMDYYPQRSVRAGVAVSFLGLLATLAMALGLLIRFSLKKAKQRLLLKHSNDGSDN